MAIPRGVRSQLGTYLEDQISYRLFHPLLLLSTSYLSVAICAQA